MAHKPQSMPVGHYDVRLAGDDAIETIHHHHNELSALRRHYAEDIQSIDKALRTYPKRMSRAKRKEARSRERRRVERYNDWWIKR